MKGQKMSYNQQTSFELPGLGSGQASMPRADTDDAIIRQALRIIEHRFALKRTALNSPTAVRDYLRLTLPHLQHEVFCCAFLDAQNRVIAFEELFRGTLTQTSVYPREIVKRALHHNCAAIIFAHNHPSGVAEPSRADEMLTQALKQALALVDVKVLDHFIVGGAALMSFAERGLL
ncbi:MAG: RadC family protein [Betaproteobacteria bacterium]